MLCEEKDRLREDYAFVTCTKEQIGELNPTSIVGVRDNHYNVTAVVKREEIPQGFDVSPISIEDLFVFMVKGDQ